MTNKLSDLQWSRCSRLAIPLLIIAALFTVSACAKNQPPVIQSVTTENISNPAAEYRIICKATDLDEDTLSYLWSADNGTIKGAGNSITWVTPEISGDYTVKVTVKDGKGGESTRSTAIKVEEPPKPVEPPKPNQPPVITKLTSEKSRIRIWTTTTIQCVAEDPDGDTLTYFWSTPEGLIQGEGNTVGWTAPGRSGEYTITITVKVTDGKGMQAEKSIDIEVFCCGSG